MRLSTRMTAAIGGCAVLLFVGEGFFSLRGEQAELEGVASRETQLLARSLQKAFRTALADRRLEEVSATLAALAAVEPTVAIFVYDEEGKVVATSKGAQPSRMSDGLAARGRTSKTPIVEFDPPENPTRLRVALRLREEVQGQSSSIVLERPLQELHAALDASRRYIALTTVLFIFVVAGLTWFLAQRYLSRPLEALVRDMQRLSGAKPVARSDLDEVAETRAEFDRLVVALDEARARTAAEVETRRGLERGLERADKLIALGQLSAALAHEIGSPLQILEGRARSLHKNATDPEATRRVAAMLVEQTERITRIVEQMLSITRPRPRQRAQLDAVELIRRVLSLLELEAKRRAVTLRLDAPAQSRLWADGDQLQQVVLNLVRNALEASPRGSTVTITLSGDDAQLELRVGDEGPGVPLEARTQLFDPFFTTKTEGTGLGLSVVRSIVREHDGDVRLAEVPTGCTIEVTLPRTEGVAA